MNRKQKILLREGNYVAEVDYEEIDDGNPFGTIVKKEDVLKSDRIRLALRSGDVAAAAKEAKVFELHPVAAE